MRYKLYELLEAYRKHVIITLFLYIVFIIPTLEDSATLKDVIILGYGIVPISKFLSITSMAFVIGFVPVGIISPSEKTKKDMASQLMAEQGNLRLQIVAEHDEDKRNVLVEQLKDLRYRQEALLNENLRREDGSFVTDWREPLLVARKRLIDEDGRLLVRNRANLLIGIIMALSGVVMPAYYILSSNGFGGFNGFSAFFTVYWPYFTIVATIEFIAIFFLSLYSSNERRLERNKSDLTNIELRLASGLMLYDEKNTRNFAILAKIIAQEERNVVLGKNESSSGISTDKLMGILSKIIGTGTK